MANYFVISFVVAIFLNCAIISARVRRRGGFYPSPMLSETENFNFTCPSANEKPKINYPEDKWAGNGVNQEFTILSLECVAAYPIYWEFIPPKGSYYTIKSKVSVQNKNFKKGDGICYKEELRIESSVGTSSYYSSSSFGRTGNYTCRSNTGKMSNSVFVFTQDNDRIFSGPRDYFEGPSRLINGKEWLIPCSANLREKYFIMDLGVRIERVESTTMAENSTNTTDDSVVLYPGDSSVRYDSKLGFLLSAANHSRPIGIYVCAGTANFQLIGPHTNIAKSAEIIIANMTTYNVIPAGEYVEYTNYKQIKIVCESDEDVYIDISKSYLLKQVGKPLQTKTDTFNFSLAYTLEETADPRSDGQQGEITCRTKKSGTILHTWKHNIRKACNATVINYDDNLGRDYYGGRYVYRSTEAYLYIQTNDDNGDTTMLSVRSSACENKAQCLLAFRYFENLSTRSTIEYASYGSPTTLSIFLRSSSMVCRCVADNTYVTMIQAVAAINNFKINPTNWSAEQTINVSAISNAGNIFVGDSVPFLCRASKYFYNEGVKWELVYKNGTREVVDSYNDTDIVDAYLGTGVIVKASTFPIINKDITSVACYAHIWNSTSWESEQFDIKHIEDKEIWDENAPIKCDGGFRKPKIVMKRNSNEGHYVHGKYVSAVNLASHVITDSEIVIQYGIDSFFLYCIAAYPVKWYFAGVDVGSIKYHAMNPRGETGPGGTSTIGNDTLHHCFKSTIHGTSYSPDQTGEYRCEKVNDKNVFSYAYIYVNTSKGGLINRGEHQTLTVSQLNSTIILPCKVSDPSVIVELYYHENDGHYKKLNSTSYLSYDPKQGFFVETASLNTSSIYICTTANRTDISDALSFTFQYNTSLIISTPTEAPAVASQNKKSTFFGFFVISVLIVSVISLQLWFLRKQLKLEHALTRIFGSYINMGSELTLNDSDRHSNGNTQLIPGLL